jgi:hypothetical protein
MAIVFNGEIHNLGVYRDLRSYEHLPRWPTSGRYGDSVGPRYPLAQILNASRYGPRALRTDKGPSLTPQPESQTVTPGEKATFNAVVPRGEVISYLWQWSDDGGARWKNLERASSPVLTISNVKASAKGALFRCPTSRALLPRLQ